MDRARWLYNQALEVSPDNPFTLVALANLERNFGDLDIAEHLLKRVLEENPESAPALQELGYVTIAKGDREGGKELMAQAEEIDGRRDKQYGRKSYVPARTLYWQRRNRQYWKAKTLENIDNGLSRLG